MICNSCDLKEICKTYNYIINIKYANLVVEECGYRSNNNSTTYGNNPITKANNLIRNNNNNNNDVVYNTQGQARPDLRKKEKEINHVTEKQKSNLINCPTCKGLTYEDDLKICETCGKTSCSNCGTNVDGKILCDDCWKKY